MTRDIHLSLHSVSGREVVVIRHTILSTRPKAYHLLGLAGGQASFREAEDRIVLLLSIRRRHNTKELRHFLPCEKDK